jgi:FkbM family methyltransferase
LNLNPVKYVLNRFLLQKKSLLAKTKHFDLRLRVMTEDVVGRHLYKYGAHEPEITVFLKEFLKFEDGDVVFDVGANIGWYSLLIDKMAGSKDITIFSFEPDPSNYRLLKENIALNSAASVSPQQRAVADVEGVLQLHLYGKSNRGRHSLLGIHEGETVDVKTIVLDEFWKAHELGDRVPRFIKMDIEGFELMALRGSTHVLERCDTVMLEYSPTYMRAASIDPVELLELMQSYGFKAYVLEKGELSPADMEALKSDDRHIDIFWLKSQ